ncbi:MAG: ABC transporter ATP-binding protein [Actinomycetota bacterium]
MALLELSGVSAAYGAIEVVHGVSLSVEPGEVVALLGSNGGGKSTLMNVISGLHAPSEGTITFDGNDVTKTDAPERVSAGICAIPEGRGIFPNLTVRENLRLATYAGVKTADVEAIAFDRFPRLAERKSQLAGTLSGGEQQMLALARAFVVSPKLLILDELSMGLAPLIVEDLYGRVAALASEGMALLVVEQFARTILPLAHRAAIMSHGLITHVGDPATIEAELSSSYLGG